MVMVHRHHCSKLPSHDAVAAVDVDSFTGDPGGEVAGEPEAGFADVFGGGVAVPGEGGFFGVVDHHAVDIADAAGGHGFDGPGTDGVDADVLFVATHFGGEVSDGAFERGL